MSCLNNLLGLITRPWIIVRRNPKRWILYVGLTLVAVGLEMGSELLNDLGIAGSADGPIAASLLYQRFATAGYRKPRPHFVQIVTLAQISEPSEIFSGACRKREFASAIVQKLITLSPSVIVLDFWYPRDSCVDGDDFARNSQLKAAIEAASSRFPVVIGMSSKTEDELKIDGDPDLAELKRAGFTRTDQILDPKFPFVGRNLTYGLARLSADTRRIPIAWRAYQDKSAVLAKSKAEQVAGLAYGAAIARDYRLEDALRRKLGPANFVEDHPFTSFISELDFQPMPAMELLCGRQIQATEDWRGCKTPEGFDRSIEDRFRGRIILIGERSSGDQHNSVLGEVPGYVLQANYIESMLDDRYLKPLTPLWEIIFSLLGAMTIVALFDLISKLRAFGISLMLVVMIAAVCNLLGVYFGRFIGFWLPLLTMPFFELLFAIQKDVNPAQSEGKA